MKNHISTGHAGNDGCRRKGPQLQDQVFSHPVRSIIAEIPNIAKSGWKHTHNFCLNLNRNVTQYVVWFYNTLMFEFK